MRLPVARAVCDLCQDEWLPDAMHAARALQDLVRNFC